VPAYNKYEYRRASHEKFHAAVDAHQNGHYAVSHYLAGVAIECMLRAYRWAIDPSWHERHDLRELMRASGVLQRLSPVKQGVVRDCLNEVALRWSVSHRYVPQDRLKAYLVRILLLQSSRVLQDNSEYMLALADRIIVECDKRCP